MKKPPVVKTKTSVDSIMWKRKKPPLRGAGVGEQSEATKNPRKPLHP